MLASTAYTFKKCDVRRRTGLAFACALFVALAASAVQCATDSGTLSQTYAASSASGAIELSLPANTEGVPLRVDYRDRDDAFDLDLLGAATGMCSFAGDCDACSYRDANPCKVTDRYGADPSLCQLPGFLGGAVSSEDLCGIGATVDVTLAGSSTRAPVATLTAFRTRAGKLMLTLTARCGWVLVPSDNLGFNSSSGAGSGAPVILEGALSYLSFNTTFAVPAEGAAAGDVERYSCYSTGLRLRGLSSKCQGLNLDLNLRFAVQRLDVISGGGGGEAVPECREAGSALAVEARLLMRVPRAGALKAGAKSAATATPASVTSSSSSSAKTAATDLASRQQLFSNGVAATMSYTASVDPRDSQAASWLKSLASQYPVVSVTPSSESLSFLVGSVRKGLQSGLASSSGDVSGADTPLLPAGLYLETCGRQAINAVVSAVVSALAAKGVTERYVSDVVCLTSPYKEVAAAELPPCAKSTSVLFNVTLEIPTSSATGVTSSLTSTLVGSSGTALSVVAASLSLSLSLSDGDGDGSGGSAADPQALADALVGAQLVAPWACLSTEGQMRMVTRLEVDLQLPKGPGVEAVSSADSQAVTDLEPAPSPTSSSPRPSPSDAPAVIALPMPRAPGPPPAVSDKSFGTAAMAAVAVAVALALVVALVAFFAIRSVRKSKAAAKAAAAAARAAAAATAGSAPASAAAAAAGKLAPPLPLKAAAAALPPALEAEPSYASSCDGGVVSSPASARGVSDGLGLAGGGIGSCGAARAAQSPSEGVVPWGSKTSAGEGLAPAASAASLEPFAAAVEAAATAAASTSTLGAPAAGLGRAPSAASSAGIGVVTAANVIREEEEEPLSSIRTARGGAPPISPIPAAAATADSPRPPPSGGRGAPARILPVNTPPPQPLFIAGGGVGSPSGAARSAASPPGQPAPRRRGRLLRLSGVSSGSLVPEASMEGTGATGRGGGAGAGAATVWSNALYDVPDQLYDSGGEGGDASVAMAASAK